MLGGGLKLQFWRQMERQFQDLITIVSKTFCAARLHDNLTSGSLFSSKVLHRNGTLVGVRDGSDALDIASLTT